MQTKFIDRRPIAYKAVNRRQTIIWTNHVLVYWRINVSLDLDELSDK